MDELVPAAAAAAAASPTVRMSSTRVKLWIYRCVVRRRGATEDGEFVERSLMCFGQKDASEVK